MHQNKISFPFICVCGSFGDSQRYWSDPKEHLSHIFFDGAAAKELGGVGFVLLISASHFFHGKMGCIISTNTRVELLALSSLLSFAAYVGIPSLTVFGDSQVIINWANQKACLKVTTLELWCDRIRTTQATFLSLRFQHIYREHNHMTDKLSKDPLNIGRGCLSFFEFMEVEKIFEGSFQAFS